MKAYREQSYYELLEVSTSATIEEIVAAYQRASRLYDSESVALYPVGDPGQIEELKKLLLEAVEILSDPELRLEYDKGLGISRSQSVGVDVSAEGQPVAQPAQESHDDPASPGTPVSNGAQPAPPERGPPTPAQQSPTAADAHPEQPMRHRPRATPRIHSTGPGYTISYLPRPMPSSARAHAIRSNESASGSRLTLGPPTAAGPELRSLAPALPLPPGADSSLAPDRRVPASFQAPRENSSPEGESTDPHLVLPGQMIRSRGAQSGRSPAVGAPPFSEPGSPPAAEPNPPPAPNAGPSREAARPPGARRALESAPVLAQDAAIADAESSLAQVQAQVAQRAREARPRGVDIPPDAVFNGELLRHVRKARGMSVQLLAERTRISPRHIENLEADRYDALPATVYLRGIVMSIARELGLDPLRVSKGYLALVEKQMGRR